ncbi:MAG: hypothetical protein COU63_02295 [Candidatus Pacebacteria bacterium CG10_big_fil_rev_8_21_14_0_10_36_11]|nr:hypothetical protein [Candidatus Pacearchaeota archaeon]OIP73596.1 MAG: hypothetical protein AUK08_03420 [Candidatus Pacebacteria bacterium CG2_30_36_39]PIR64823.1 MAG: hypothetical protein COU63_02295 [Candidatus Pacebacteria bacterium CG10_big_fil_rev_8_21_14_0_10_36_11]PJC42589.1 MAG: hypothetical protein CO040_03660 [Candidatus Pacebacteria bacterium CG_4_9_14_0_2_um_filter_36_8]
MSKSKKLAPKKKLWFRRKLYGWGWFPITWQGWLVLAVYMLLIFLLTLLLDNEVVYSKGFFGLLLPIILLTLLLIYITYETGEKPRWQWGKRK